MQEGRWLRRLPIARLRSCSANPSNSLSPLIRATAPIKRSTRPQRRLSVFEPLHSERNGCTWALSVLQSKHSSSLALCVVDRSIYTRNRVSVVIQGRTIIFGPKMILHHRDTKCPLRFRRPTPMAVETKQPIGPPDDCNSPMAISREQNFLFSNVHSWEACSNHRTTASGALSAIPPVAKGFPFAPKVEAL